MLVAAIQVLCAKALGPADGAGTTIAIAAGFALRLVAYRRGWRLPRGLEWQPRRTGQHTDPGDHRDPQGT